MVLRGHHACLRVSLFSPHPPKGGQGWSWPSAGSRRRSAGAQRRTRHTNARDGNRAGPGGAIPSCLLLPKATRGKVAPRGSPPSATPGCAESSRPPARRTTPPWPPGPPPPSGRGPGGAPAFPPTPERALTGAPGRGAETHCRPPLARGGRHPLTSDQTRLPAEFKHITKRRKRN